MIITEKTPKTTVMNVVTFADIYMKAKHDGQIRKLTKEPYWMHPTRVAAMAIDLSFDENHVSIALLHDVIEDCGITYANLFETFGKTIADGVWALTNPSRSFKNYSRKSRKTMDFAHYRRQSNNIKELKYLDRYDNVKGMYDFLQTCKNDAAIKSNQQWFWLYINETQELLEALEIDALGKYDMSLLLKGFSADLIKRCDGKPE